MQHQEEKDACLQDRFELSAEETSELLAVSRTRLSQMTSRGDFSYERRRVENRYRVFYCRSEIETYLKLREQAAVFRSRLNLSSSAAEPAKKDSEHSPNTRQGAVTVSTDIHSKLQQPSERLSFRGENLASGNPWQLVRAQMLQLMHMMERSRENQTALPKVQSAEISKFRTSLLNTLQKIEEREIQHAQDLHLLKDQLNNTQHVLEMKLRKLELILRSRRLEEKESTHHSLKPPPTQLQQLFLEQQQPRQENPKNKFRRLRRTEPRSLTPRWRKKKPRT